VPAGTFVQTKTYGLTEVLPNSFRPRKKSTPLIEPSGSDASTLITMFAGARNVAPSAGLRIETVGGRFGRGTVTNTGADVVEAP
jgi:hypothetical protein